MVDLENFKLDYKLDKCLSESFPLSMCSKMNVSSLILFTSFMTAWGIVKTTAPRCHGQFDKQLPEAEFI